MSNTTDTKLLELAQRIRDLREIIGYTPEQMAERTEVSTELYLQYEQAACDLPFSFIHKCALNFGVGLTELLEGRSAKLTSYAVTRRGEGLVTAKLAGKQIGRKPGTTVVTKKAIAAKEMIKKHSKHFGGSLSNEETIQLLRISRNSFYKYIKELKIELEGGNI